MKYCRNCRKNVADEHKFCPECGMETEESKEEILFPKEEIANLKTELTFTRDDLNRNIKFLKDEIKSSKEKIEQIESGAIRTIKRVHIFQFALITGFIEAILGFILSILMIPLIGLLATIPGIPPELKTLLGGGILIIILLITISFFIIGFISGAIQAVIYNLAASTVGGIKITLSGKNE